MRASIKWLKDYVEFSETPETLAEMMTMAGLPVEQIEYLGEGIENIVTGKVVEIKHHPQADKLFVCKVNTGKEMLTIVTGATNVSAQNVVPVALPGAKLPNGKKIKPTVLRGIDSCGMLCSAEELNIDSKLLTAAEREGIYILPSDTPIGVDIKEVLGLDDVVLEFELTANRADCFSMLGLAREIAVLTGSRLRKPMLNLRENGQQKANALVNVTIADPILCPRFCARVLQNVKVGPSPLWLRQRLQTAGMRSISNVVDVTNFVMLEMGQPMHAYDYNLLSRHEIIVRRAEPGEKLTTLDDIKRQLNPEMIVIADAVQAVGVAGVMGGLATEVTANTQNVLLEAAAFNNASIRRTARALGLRSEASGRFERGVDIANATRAIDRAAQLLEEMGACTVCPGVVDKYPGVVLPKQITFTADSINDYLGTTIAKATMIDILQKLEFAVDTHADKITVTVPTWRGDVSGMADISEEIARIYGFDNIPSTVPSGHLKQGKQSYVQTIIDQLKTALAATGLNEIISFSFTHPATLDKLNVPSDSELRKAIGILNPITDDFPLLRTTLLGGIMESIVANLTKKNDDIKIYEIGAVYRPQTLPLQELPAEPVMLAGALSGRRETAAWNQARDTVDFYDAKGVVEVLLASLGISGYQVKPGGHYAMHPGKTAVFAYNGETIATVGEAHPKVLDAFGINRPVYLFEIAVNSIVNNAVKLINYQPLPKFPAISRDIAMIFPQAIAEGDIEEAITTSGGALLSETNLFDVFAGGNIPQDSRSLAFSLTFRAADRTLTDDEVDQQLTQIVNCLEIKFDAKMRS